MSELNRNRRVGRFTQLAGAAILMALLLVMTTTPAPARGESDDGTFPTEADLAAMPKPTVLKETRQGDVTTITLSIPAGADTFTSSGQPNTNFSSSPNLRVGFNIAQNFQAQRTFLFFPTNSIPSNATIQSAVMQIWVSGFSPNGDTPMAMEARFLNSSWDPSTLTWNSYNPAWGASIGVGQVPAVAQMLQASATGPVAEWVSGQRANHGIMIQGDETPQQRERTFFAIDAGNGLFPRLIVTYEIDTTPPTASVNTLPQWSRASFNVSWSGSDNPGGSGIRHFDVQFRGNGGAWQNWQTATTATSATFTGQNGIIYEFRARAVDNANNVGTFPNNPQASTTVDTILPSSGMNALPQFTYSDSFTVSWWGNDGLSGIAYFDVEYQVNGGAWQPLLNSTTLSATQFTGASTDSTYGFRVRAADRAGNLQEFPPMAQTQTTISTSDPQAWIVPFSSSFAPAASFLVQWGGSAAPGASVVAYDVQFRFNNGAWQPWLQSVNSTSQMFTAQLGDGVYAFQVRARDSVGRTGPFEGGPGSSIILDLEAPFVTAQSYLSITNMDVTSRR